MHVTSKSNNPDPDPRFFAIRIRYSGKYNKKNIMGAGFDIWVR
jgi:hypothetical protein